MARIRAASDRPAFSLLGNEHLNIQYTPYGDRHLRKLWSKKKEHQSFIKEKKILAGLTEKEKRKYFKDKHTKEMEEWRQKKKQKEADLRRKISLRRKKKEQNRELNNMKILQAAKRQYLKSTKMKEKGIVESKPVEEVAEVDTVVEEVPVTEDDEGPVQDEASNAEPKETEVIEDTGMFPPLSRASSQSNRSSNSHKSSSSQLMATPNSSSVTPLGSARSSDSKSVNESLHLPPIHENPAKLQPQNSKTLLRNEKATKLLHTSKTPEQMDPQSKTLHKQNSKLASPTLSRQNSKDHLTQNSMTTLTKQRSKPKVHQSASVIEKTKQDHAQQVKIKAQESNKLTPQHYKTKLSSQHSKDKLTHHHSKSKLSSQKSKSSLLTSQKSKASLSSHKSKPHLTGQKSGRSLHRKKSFSKAKSSSHMKSPRLKPQRSARYLRSQRSSPAVSPRKTPKKPELVHHDSKVLLDPVVEPPTPKTQPELNPILKDSPARPPPPPRTIHLFGMGSNNAFALTEVEGESNIFTRPVPILKEWEFINQIKDLQRGSQHTLILLHDGSVYGMGSNIFGQLGVGKENQETVYKQPVKIEFDHNEPIKYIRVGGFHSVALSEFGTLCCFGSNSNQQCGFEKDVKALFKPTQVMQKYSVNLIECGFAYTMIDMRTKIISMGSNDFSQLGNSHEGINELCAEMLLPLKKDQRVVQMTCGQNHSAVLLNDGQVYVSGFNVHSEAGVSTKHSIVKTPMPIKQQYFKGYLIKRIYSTKHNTIFSGKRITGERKFFATGDGKYLGLPKRLKRPRALEMKHLFGHTKLDLAKVSIHEIHTLGTAVVYELSDGSYWGCGQNEYGQCGTGQLARLIERPTKLDLPTNCRVASFGGSDDSSIIALYDVE